MNRLALLAIVVALELPAQEPTPTSIELPSSTVCGTNVKGKVNLSGPVKSDPFEVEVTSNQPTTIDIKSPVTVAKDATFGGFEVKCIQATQSMPVMITARNRGGSTTATMQVLAPVLQTLSVQPHNGGESVQGQVTLIGRAPTGGVVVSLSSSSSKAAVPQSVIVPSGQLSAPFTVTTRAVSQPTTVNILGTGFGVSKTVDLVVQPAAPTSVTFHNFRGEINTSGSVIGGTATKIKVTLSRQPLSGQTVSLTSSNPGVIAVPATVTFDGSSAERTIDVTPGNVSQTSTVNIAATAGEISSTGSLRVLPPSINQVSVSPNTATGGQVAQLNIRLDSEAPASGFPGGITTSNPDLVRVPQGFVVPAGEQTVSVPIQVLRIEKAADATISAGANGVKFAAVLKLEPEGPAAISLSPTSVVGGAKATATVTRVPSPEPLTVLLSTDSNATILSSVTFGPNSGSENVLITTEPVPAQSAVKITAKTGAVVRTAYLRLDPPPITRLTITPSPAKGGDQYTVQFVIARAVSQPVTVRITTEDGGGTFTYDATVPANSTTGSKQLSAVPGQTSVRVTAGVFSPGTQRVTGTQTVFLTVNPQ